MGEYVFYFVLFSGLFFWPMVTLLTDQNSRATRALRASFCTQLVAVSIWVIVSIFFAGEEMGRVAEEIITAVIALLCTILFILNSVLAWVVNLIANGIDD